MGYSLSILRNMEKHQKFFKPETLRFFGTKKQKVVVSEIDGNQYYCEYCKPKCMLSGVYFEKWTARLIKEDGDFGTSEIFDDFQSLLDFLGKKKQKSTFWK